MAINLTSSGLSGMTIQSTTSTQPSAPSVFSWCYVKKSATSSTFSLLTPSSGAYICLIGTSSSGWMVTSEDPTVVWSGGTVVYKKSGSGSFGVALLMFRYA